MPQEANEVSVILIDTNVWLDMYIPRRQGAQMAARLIEVAQEQGASLLFASHACLDVFQKVSFEQKSWVRSSYGELTEAWARSIKGYAWDCVNDMREIATGVPTDSSDLYLACRQRDRHDDLEDDLVIAACRRAGANYLVTNDRKLLRHAPLEAKTAAEMLQLLEAGLAKGTAPTDETRDATYWLRQWLNAPSP